MAGRPLFERALRSVIPRPDAGFLPDPVEHAPGLWTVERRLRLPPALLLSTRMSIVRLASGGLLLHSPVKRDARVAAAVASLGRVEAILAPNSFHYLFVAEWLERSPRAWFGLAPGLDRRVPRLPPGTTVCELPAAWRETLDLTIFGPVATFTEVVLLHRSSNTLILTDLAFNVVHIEGTWNRVAWRLYGVPRRFGPTLSARLTLLRDVRSAGAMLRPLLDWNFVRILVTHGEPVERDAHAEFTRAFARYLRG